MPTYSTHPCDDDDCDLAGTHYHQIGFGNDVIWKIEDDPEEHDTVQLAADESVRPTPGLGGNIRRSPRNNLAPNVLGMKALVYGSCAAIVLLCLVFLIWTLWPDG
jgi:hypothetical protein